MATRILQTVSDYIYAETRFLYQSVDSLRLCLLA
jgi:hypothetical protein